MVSVERPSEMGTPQWNGPQQRHLRFALDTAEVNAYKEKGFLILREVFQPVGNGILSSRGRTDCRSRDFVES